MFSESLCQLSFVLPLFNEAKRLPATLAKIESFQSRLPKDHEWIFVVEPSQDATLQIVEDYCRKNFRARFILNEKQQGKGYAVQSGVLNARGSKIFFMDADLATPLEEIFKFLENWQEHDKILIASRRLPNSIVEPKTSWIRRFLSICLNVLVRSMGLAQQSDTQCGFKAFHRSIVPQLFRNLKMRGFSFDIEILSIALRHKIPVKEIAVRWSPKAASSVSLLRDSIMFFVDLIRLRFLL